MRAIVEAVKRDGKAFKGTDGEWYSTRDSSCAVLQAGQEVEFDNVKNGRWNNIENNEIRVVSAAQATPAGSAGAPPALPWNQYNDKEWAKKINRAIGRQNALTNAVTAAGLLGEANPDSYVATVLGLAQSFAMWTAGATVDTVLEARDVQRPAPTPPVVENPPPGPEYAPSAGPAPAPTDGTPVLEDDVAF